MQRAALFEQGSSQSARPQRSRSALLLVFVGLIALCLGLYRGALSGPFVSDDISLVQNNPFVTSPDANLLEVFDPLSDARFQRKIARSPDA